MSETGSQLGSVRSGTTGAMSETSSQRSDARMLRKHKRAGDENDEGDLLEQKRSFQEGIFTCMSTLVRQSALSSWKFALIKILLEGLMPFIVVFNPSASWVINTSNPVWQVVRWTVWRSPIMRIYGYDVYIRVLYVMAIAVLLSVFGLVWLTLAMRRQEQSKWLRTAAAALHIVYELIFMVFYVSFLDYFVFVANCHFTGSVRDHVYFTGVKCLEMPHVLHMTVALVAAAVHFCVTALMVVASCDLNPVSTGYLASPDAYSRLKILAAKAAFIIIADDLQSYPQTQAVLMIIAVAFICWWNFRKLPFYRLLVNVVWCSSWICVLFTTVLLAVLEFGKDHSVARRRQYTMYVLYGIFPVLAGGLVICGLHAWWAMRPAKKFMELASFRDAKLQKMHKFSHVHQVEVLSRVMRKFNSDGVVDEDAAALGDAVIKAGMLSFPNAPFLYILFANFLLEVRKDGPSARTQLQLAARHSPTLVERYQVYCTMEASKRLKDSQDGGMDLQAYIEFRRNFKAVLRVHKEVLALEMELWKACMRTTLRVTVIDEMLDELEAATNRANQVYKRVLERYPTNGKLLRCYGKFLEDIRHDAVAAGRVYADATRHGGADAIMSLDLSSVQQASNKPEFLTSLSLLDDAVVVINSEGIIMMVSQAVQSVFGYSKVELEGSNVSILMPQPYCQRHAGYLSRYIAGGEPHILDNVREVVALHKDRYVFPLMLCVTKMSGSGSDSVFLGVLRPLPANSLHMRAWLAPNGTFLCGDQQFASLCGMAEKDLVGRSLASLCASSDSEVNKLLERFRDASSDELEAGLVHVDLLLRHRFLDPVPVDITIGLAGTDGQRIIALSCRRTDGLEGNIMVVDTHMRLRFASLGVAAMLNYSMRKLVCMRLDQLLPAPYNTLHAKWLRDPPHAPTTSSCRSGRVVHLLNDAGSPVPVRIRIHSATGDDVGMSLYVVQVDKVPAEEAYEEKRLVLLADIAGRVLAVSRPDSSLFGFVGADLVGTNLCDCVDVFEDWRNRNGESQLQLLLLALVDREQETPGTSWRVRVHTPAPPENTVRLPAIAGAMPGVARKSAAITAISACLQAELAEATDDVGAAGEGGPGFGASVDSLVGAYTAAGDMSGGVRVRLTLWRRDLLTGVMELDEQLVIRKASHLTGLIVGLPSTSMSKKPIQKFLDVPYNKSWEAIASSHSHKRSALKSSPGHGMVSPLMALIGPHPDTGTMRIMVQGVQTLGPGGRPKVTVVLHPDTTFVGAHADLLRVLHLVDLGSRGESRHHRSHAMSRIGTCNTVRGAGNTVSTMPLGDGAAAAAAAAGDGDGGGDAAAAVGMEPVDGVGVGHPPMLGKSETMMAIANSDSGDEEGGAGEDGDGHSDGRRSGSEIMERQQGSEEDPEAKDQAKMHRRASSKSDFVAQWVRTVSKQALQLPDGPALQGALERPASPGQAQEAALPGGPPTGYPMLQHPAPIKSGRLTTIPEGPKAPSEAPMDGISVAGGDGGGDPGGGGDVDAVPDKWEKGSEGESSADDGSQAASGITSITDAQSAMDIAVDARRGRLLKSLRKVLMGPLLMTPLERLRIHSYVLLAVMLITHVICYVVLRNAVAKEHTGVYMVQRQSKAMDRAELLVVRILIGTFCERANNTARVSACTPKLQVHLANMKTSIQTLEESHHGVYLGAAQSSVTAPDHDVYDVWTNPRWEYDVYLDTEPPQMLTEATGVWQLGNRFIAASREALYWMPRLRDEFKFHRAYRFMLTNGLGALFTGYATSLDLLMDAAWKSLDDLRTVLITLLIVEVLAVHFSCLLYEWLLMHRVERARLLGVFSMVGLPGPVLRQLGNREIKVLDESDDDDEDDDASVRGGGGDQQQQQQQDGATHSKNKDGAGGAAAAGGKDGGGKAPGGSAVADRRRPDSAGSISLDAGRGAGGKAQTKALLNEQDTDVFAVSGGNEDGWDPDAEIGGKNKGQRGAGIAEDETPLNGFSTRRSGAAPAAGKSAQKPSTWGRTYGTQVINGKALIPSRWRVVKFMLIPVLWFTAVLVVYVVSILSLTGMQGPLASLNMASHVIYRYTRVRAVGFAFLSQDDAPSRALWRDMLGAEVRLFSSEYDALMYGGTALSQADSVFTHAVPPSTFASSEFANEFFRTKRCFRYNQSLCAKADSPYYEVTHNGLDVMVRRMLTEMELLISDADEDVAYNTSRWTYMYNVGTFDLYEGLQQAAQLFVDYSISRYNQVTDMHTILLIATLILFGAYVVFVLWPHLAKLKNDAARQSALLSHVPPEVDTVGHVKATCRRAHAVTRRGKAQSAVVPVA